MSRSSASPHGFKSVDSNLSKLTLFCCCAINWTRRVFQACYPNPHDHHPTHFWVSLFPLIHSPRRWQHARGLRLALAFIRLGVGNTLGGCSSHWHSFAQRWQHARGLHLKLAVLRPSVGITLGGCVSNLHSFAPALVTRSGAASRIGIPSPRHWQHARGLHLTTRC
jgi:hypothetical protein